MSHRRWLLIFILVALIAGVWWAHRNPKHNANAYIADPSATLWSPTPHGRRQVAGAPFSGSEEGHGADERAPSAEEKSGLEDWLLVLYSPANPGSSPGAANARPEAGPSIPIAGWVLSRFVELNPPRPIGDYIGTAGRRVVAWAQLDTAPDPTGEQPQYGGAATMGGEGQP